MSLVDENTLVHYGTKGMKWGERNYQNPDGTYTELGKERRRVGYKETKSEAEKKKKTLANEKEPDIKIGGKAYKDMSKKELKAAKKRARHNEAERRAQREFNRDKARAIDEGDLQFLAKNRAKLSDDDIYKAVDRYKKLKAISDLADEEARATQDKYFNKAMKLLEKGGQATHLFKNIYMDVKDMESKHYTTKQEQTRAKRAEKEFENIDKDRKRKIFVEERDYQDKKAATERSNRLEDERIAYQKEKDAVKDRYDQWKDDRDYQTKLDQDKRNWSHQLSREKLQDQKDVEKAKKEYDRWYAEQLVKATKDDRDYAYKLWRDSAKDLYEQKNKGKNKNNSSKDDDEINERLDKIEELLNDRFSGSQGKIGGFFNRSRKEKDEYNTYREQTKNNDYSFLDNYTKSLFDKNRNQLDNYTNYYKDYFKDNQRYGSKEKKPQTVTMRDERWKKDLKKKAGDSRIVDKWVKEMTEKYRTEHGLSKEAAEQKAEDYVDYWIDLYGGKKR